MEQEKEADLPGIERLKNLLNGDEILKRLAHLFSMNVQVAGVPEVVDPVVTLVVGLTLGDLVVVVREAEVDTSCVDVNWVRLKDRGSHSTALDVPSWTTFTPRRWPFWFALFTFFPKCEILFTAFFAHIS